MRSFDLDITKEIVSKIKQLNYSITDNPLKAKLPCVQVGDVEEVNAGVKTHRCNNVTSVIDIWGGYGEPSYKNKEMKNSILQKLTESNYNIKNMVVEAVNCTLCNTIREEEKESNVTKYLYHTIIEITFVIREEEAI